MKFTRKSADVARPKDEVYTMVALAKQAKQEYGEDQVIDATIGSLYGEDGKLVALRSVFEHYDQIPANIKANYGPIAGSQAYQESVYQWVLQDIPFPYSHGVIATPGGTGAIHALFLACLEEGQAVLIPDIGWGNYKLIATENNFQPYYYSMFEEDHFNLSSVKEKIEQLQEKQDRIVLVINDPCHNPTGYSLTNQEWEELIALVNEASKKTPIVIINDIAYFDYAYDQKQSRAYMQHFASISDQVLVTIAFSCSKSLTSYGLRCGAALVLGKNEQDVTEMMNVLQRGARSTWSNIPNAAMENFIWVTHNNREAFLTEKESYLHLLKQRSDIFMKEANECGLETYPYKEGFFITLKEEDPSRAQKIKEAFMQQNIYTILVNKGIRVAICSVPYEKCKGLAIKMKSIIDEME